MRNKLRNFFKFHLRHPKTWWHLIRMDIWWDGYDEGYDQGYDAALLLEAHRKEQRRRQEQRLLDAADKDLAQGFNEAYEHIDIGGL